MKRTHIEPMPRGLAALLRFVERAMLQPGVQEVHILTKGIEVVREMPEDEDVVVPKGTDDIDFDFLLGKIELLTHPFSEEEHGTEALFLAAQTLQTERKVRPQWLILPGVAVGFGVARPEACGAAEDGVRLSSGVRAAFDNKRPRHSSWRCGSLPLDVGRDGWDRRRHGDLRCGLTKHSSAPGLRLSAPPRATTKSCLTCGFLYRIRCLRAGRR